jgi:hypothetical protein
LGFKVSVCGMPGSDLAMDQDLRSAKKISIHNKIIWICNMAKKGRNTAVYDGVFGVILEYLGIKISLG